MERLIESKDYTLEVRSCIQQIEYRMDTTNVVFTEQDIKVFEVGEDIYILANPQLGYEPVFDDFGYVTELIPLYNITMLYNEDWIKTSWEQGEWRATIEIPKLRIIRPDLCAKVIADYQIVFGSI